MSYSESPLKEQIFKNMKMVRTFHPVGQGAFYTERFYEGDKNVFNMVYDCGSSTKGQYLKNEINDAFKDGTGKAEIDILFVSHFHNDHVNGIEELARQYHIKQLAIPAPKLLSKDIVLNDYMHNLCVTSDIYNIANQLVELCFTGDGEFEFFRDIQIIPLEDSAIQFPIIQWEYLPFCGIHIAADKFMEAFLQEFNTFHEIYDNFTGSDFVAIRDYFKNNENVDKLKKFYNNYFKQQYRNDNYYSMTLLSKQMGRDFDEAMCLYTGDYPAREKDCLINLKKRYRAFWKRIKTIQAPHHGSGYDNPQDLHDEKGRNCVISYGQCNRYKHPNRNALLAIHFSKSTLFTVNEDRATDCTHCFTY